MIPRPTRVLILAMLGWMIPAEALLAQDASGEPIGEAQTSTPPGRIDIRAPVTSADPEYENCSDEQDAAEISGEIIVCRRKTGSENRLYSKDEAERRHAERTQGQKPVDVFGIPNHGHVVARGCFIPPCPPPMPILIDVKALPTAPPGSDADRIARGLAPRGRDAAWIQPPTQEAQVVTEPHIQENAEELGLPAPAEEAGEVNPSKSASPEEGQSD